MECRVVARSQEFEPFGVAEVGSAERSAYILNLQGYLAATLLPIFETWTGDMPAHLQKARPPAPVVHGLESPFLGWIAL